jgi:uncharacterized protein DUF6788
MLKLSFSDPLPGAVCEQWKRCGKPNCRSGAGELHGPYLQRGDREWLPPRISRRDATDRAWSRIFCFVKNLN